MNYDDLHTPWLPILDHLLTTAPLPRQGITLDLGCGMASKWPRYRAILGGEVGLIGLDWDRQALANANRRFAMLTADAQSIPLANASCDAALCIAALGSFAAPAQALSELRRVLRPNAPALILTAEQRWAIPSQWPTELNQLLAIWATTTTLPSADSDLCGDLVALCHSAGFHTLYPRAFSLDHPFINDPHLAELRLIPWPALRQLLQPILSPADLHACDQINHDLDYELATVVLTILAN
jgi:SAM-dependent methyltransferase